MKSGPKVAGISAVVLIIGWQLLTKIIDTAYSSAVSSLAKVHVVAEKVNLLEQRVNKSDKDFDEFKKVYREDFKSFTKEFMELLKNR